MLIILEMANNAMGSIDLGKRIIDEFKVVTDKFPQFEYAFKWQYRDLPTFIHPSCNPNDKYVKRFRETNLSLSDRWDLKEHAYGLGFKTACTPFDEVSVLYVVEHGYDILKVGSPSFADWSLWNEILQMWHGPIIASCGGATEEEIDRVVKMCKYVDLTLMHCVSEYPTKPENLNYGQITWLKNKYPYIPIGFSSHMDKPHGVSAAGYFGVDVVEFHVCISDHIKPNYYSKGPTEADWELSSLGVALAAVGESTVRIPGPRPTQFIRRMIDGRMWWKPEDNVLDDIRAIIKKSLVVIPKDSRVLLSHHYGIDKFRETGAAVIECFNRDGYAKKILVMLPNQEHPAHYHVKKDETFHVLYGRMTMHDVEYKPADHVTVEPMILHRFVAGPEGLVFEEISTHDSGSDSFYHDEKITNNKTDRKTVVEL